MCAVSGKRGAPLQGSGDDANQAAPGGKRKKANRSIVALPEIVSDSDVVTIDS